MSSTDAKAEGAGSSWRVFFRRLFRWKDSSATKDASAEKAKARVRARAPTPPPRLHSSLSPPVPPRGIATDRPRRRGLPFCAENFDLSAGRCDSGVWGPPPLPPHPSRMPAELHVLLGTLPRRREYMLCGPGGALYPPDQRQRPAPAAAPARPSHPCDELDDRFGWFYDLPPAAAFQAKDWPQAGPQPQVAPYEPVLHYYLGNLPPPLMEHHDFADGPPSPHPTPTPSPMCSPQPHRHHR